MSAVSFSGIASGIDGDAIIDATIEARRIAAIPLENSIAFNEKETEAFDEFSTKLIGLSDSLKEFMTAYGGAVSKTGSSSNSDAVSVSAGSNAPLTSTELSVQQVARGATMSFDDRFSSAEEALFPSLAGTETIDFIVGTGDSQTTVSVEVDSTTTLNELASAIGDAGEGLLSGSVVNAGTASSPEYVLVVNSLNPGEEKGTLSVSVPSSITGQGVFQAQQIQQAQNAVIEVSGIGTVIRESNTINDVIPGVTLELKQAGGAPVTINIDNDYEKTAQRVEEFVSQLNEVITYAAENNKVERVEEDGKVKNVYSALAKSRVDDQAISTLKNAISDARSVTAGGDTLILANLGLSINRDGTYDFDTAAFIKAASKDPGAAQDLISDFADEVASAKGIVANYTGFAGMISTVKDANEEENERLNEKLERLERILEKQTEMLKRQFTNLETTISDLNSSSSALLSMLGQTV
jgi:flagellar hook-associated protein 2